MRRTLTLATAAFALAGFASVATAQTIRLETVSVRPGQNATVRVFLQSPVNVSAVNFTVRANTADVPGAITGNKGSAAAISSASYVFVPNNANIVSGGTREFRGVLYSNVAGQSFSATSEIHIATLTVPTTVADPDLSVTLEAPNTFVNGVTALVGVSDAQGRSLANGAPITSGSTARPTTVNGGVRLDPVIADLPFTGGDTLRTGWTFSQRIPDPATTVAQTANVIDDGGFLITLTPNFLFSFGTLEMTADSADALKPAVDSVMVYSWDMTSNATEARQLPSMRLNAYAKDFSWIQLSTVGETAARPTSLPEVLPTGSLTDASKRIRAASFVPVSLGNSPSDGVTMAINFLAFSSGAANTTLGIQNLNVYSRPVSQLTNQTVLYTGNFAAGSTDGFTLARRGVTDPAIGDENAPGNAGYLCTVDTANGIALGPNSNNLGVTSIGGVFYLAFGSFERIFTAAQLPIDGSRLYRLDFRARTTVADASKAPTIRVRFTAGQTAAGTPNTQFPNGQPQFDFTQEVVLESVGNETAMHLPTTTTARTYTSYFSLPAESTGGQALIALDVYPGFAPGDWQQGAVVFEGLTVSSYDFPTP